MKACFHFLIIKKNKPKNEVWDFSMLHPQFKSGKRSEANPATPTLIMKNQAIPMGWLFVWYDRVNSNRKSMENDISYPTIVIFPLQVYQKNPLRIVGIILQSNQGADVIYKTL
jgi:hypothetical protein